MKTIKELKEEIVIIIKDNVYGYVCKECQGGGANGQEKCVQCAGTGIVNWEYNLGMKKLMELLIARDAEWEKQYKDICKNCWNKGYATELTTRMGFDEKTMERFETSPKTKINYCSCERGKNVKKLVEQARREGRVEAEEREREKLKKQVRHWLTKQQAKGQPLGVMEFFPWSIFSSLNQPNEGKE